MNNICYYLGKILPFVGLVYNKVKYPDIHFEIGNFVEIKSKGYFVYGKNLRIGERTRINIIHKLIIEDNVDISRFVYIYAENIFIGNRVDIQDNVRIYGNVTIHDFVIIAPNVFISSGTHVFDKERTIILEQDKKYKIDKPIIIEEDVWIGINSVILPGVTIGKGTIIGANSVVTKSTGEYEVWGGIPAKKIKNRYKENENE